MKKLISLLLVLAMAISLMACAESGASDKGNANAGGDKTGEQAGQSGGAAASDLQIGYAKIDITPDFSVGLGGYSDSETRRSEGFRTFIYATCIAATYGEDTILMFTIDNCAASHSVANKIRNVVSPATGIPESNIFVGATHCHSCPSLTTSDAEGAKYYQLLLDATVEGATQALADRSPAKMEAGTQIIEGMNFVRHYEMADGTYAGSNFGDFSKTIVGHATENDPQLVLVKFDRGDDKKDVLMVNWQAHPDRGSEIGRNLIAASWVGPLRDELEKLCGMNVAYFTGASGNQNQDSKIPEEMNNLDWEQYGIKMGQLVNDALSCLKPVEGTGIKVHNMMFDAPIDHTWDHLLNEAKAVYDLWKSAGKSAGDALGKTYNFTSSYQARAIISRAGRPVSEQLEVNAFSICGVGFTTGTYEMFSDQSNYVKENSPFDVTFIITGNSGYIPSRPAYEYRSYEADTGMYAPGTAESLAENYVEMLKKVK